MMKMRDGVYLKQINGVDVLLAERGVPCPKVLPLNASGAFFAEQLLEGAEPGDMAKQASELYEVPVEAILPGLKAFLQQLSQHGYLIKA